jgi:ubiquinone/menaquinone biosynthesis C-methylase UbiE
MLEHVERPWVVVHEIQRILKPGGVCIITAPFITPYHADPYDFFRYTVQGMESLFTHEGCAIVESGRYGNTPTVLAEMIHFSHFSHYKKLSKTRQWWRDHFMNGLKRLSAFIDPYFKNDALYANVYVVARKK